MLILQYETVETLRQLKLYFEKLQDSSHAYNYLGAVCFHFITDAERLRLTNTLVSAATRGLKQFLKYIQPYMRNIEREALLNFQTGLTRLLLNLRISIYMGSL